MKSGRRLSVFGIVPLCSYSREVSISVYVMGWSQGKITKFLMLLFIRKLFRDFFICDISKIQFFWVEISILVGCAMTTLFWSLIIFLFISNDVMILLQ